jgi:hypothetical protein
MTRIKPVDCNATQSHIASAIGNTCLRRGMIFYGRLRRWHKLPIHRSISDQSEVCMYIFICKHVLVEDSTCYCYSFSWLT